MVYNQTKLKMFFTFLLLYSYCLFVFFVYLCVLSCVFQELPEPNRACLVGVNAFFIWNNLCDLVYQTPTKSYKSQIPVAFGIPGHVTTKHLPDTPC